MRNADVVLLTESQIAAIHAALHAAAAENPCGQKPAARHEALLQDLLADWGEESLHDLPASSFRHVLNWCAQQSLPDERGKLERHAQAALDDLKAAAHALHEYREALRGVRAVAGELLPLLMGRLSLPGNAGGLLVDALDGELAALDRELVATKDRGTGMALGLLRLARGLDQQEVRHA
ncbi:MULTISPECIES: hypothetical protein [Desulfovibrio]|uniref:hypothetical protein n=1 Tax=Desulfovibrio TaxID=872 RepID=UPI0026EB36C3|nr:MULTISPECIES: hypothetical protein [Desulfovibrio]MCI7616962.1 hypothetical protein [Desulfovibrio piger]MDY4807136.1 hypothetical protein [Desulfovibrio sp.]